MSKFLRRSLLIFIIKGFQTIVFIFIVISTMFRPIYPLAFFRCLSNSGTFTEHRTTSFIETMGVACSDSVSHNQVQAERFQKICSPYDIRTVFTSGSTLRRYLFRVKPPTEFNMTKNCVYSIPCSCGKIYKGETGRPLKVRLEEHRKAVV